MSSLPAPASAPLAGSPATASGRVAPVPGRLAQVGSFALRLLAGAYLLIVLTTVVVYKATFVEHRDRRSVLRRSTASSSACTSSRASSSRRCTARRSDHGLEPRVAIVMPAFNEEEAIAASLSSLLALDYPAELLEIVAVNDGSTDDTLRRDAARRRRAPAGACASSTSGATAASARRWPPASARPTPRSSPSSTPTACSSPTRCAMLVQGFHDRGSARSAATPTCSTSRETWLTKMQAVRYFVAFKVVKAAESVFSA